MGGVRERKWLQGCNTVKPSVLAGPNQGVLGGDRVRRQCGELDESRRVELAEAAVQTGGHEAALLDQRLAVLDVDRRVDAAHRELVHRAGAVGLLEGGRPRLVGDLRGHVENDGGALGGVRVGVDAGVDAVHGRQLGGAVLSGERPGVAEDLGRDVAGDDLAEVAGSVPGARRGIGHLQGPVGALGRRTAVSGAVARTVGRSTGGEQADSQSGCAKLGNGGDSHGSLLACIWVGATRITKTNSRNYLLRTMC